MFKRRAEDTVTSSSPSKRCRGFCSVDLRLESMAPSAGVSLSSPSVLALLGNRCRKRHFYFDETEERDFDFTLSLKGTHGECGLLKHTLPNKMQQQTTGNAQDRRFSAVAKTSNKRPREDSEATSETTHPKTMAKMDPETLNSNEDNCYNSFQFWRTPLPELDMSLLEKTPPKDPDAMET